MVERLRDIGEEIKYFYVQTLLLSGLSESYEMLVTGLDTGPDDELTMEYFNGKLVDEYKCKTESINNDGALVRVCFNHLRTIHRIYTAAGRPYCVKRRTRTSFRAQVTVGVLTVAQRESQCAGLVAAMSAAHPRSLLREAERESTSVNKANPHSDRRVQ